MSGPSEHPGDLFQRLPVPLFRCTPDGRFLEANQALVSVLGYPTRPSLEAASFAALFADPADFEHHNRVLEQQGSLPGSNARLKCHHGSTIWVRERCQALRDANGQIYYEGTFEVAGRTLVQGSMRDARERNKLEKQLHQDQRMEAIGRLAGGIAHDFNNLLTVIAMYCDLLLDRLDSNTSSHADVEQIKKAGERAATLTRQLLAFSRQQVLRPQILDLNLVVEDEAIAQHGLLEAGTFYLEKPFTAQTLARRVDKMLQSSHADGTAKR